MTDINKEQTGNVSDEISLKDLIKKIESLFKYLQSKLTLILIVGVLGATFGLAYSFLKKPIYVAKLSFALQDEKSGGGLNGALGLASQFGFDIGGAGAGGEFSGDNLLVLMKSRSVVEKTLLTPITINGKKQTLAELYISFNQIRDKWKGKPEERIQFTPDIDRATYTLQQDSVLGTFYNDLIKTNLSIDKVDKKLSIILISVNSKSELFSKYFTEVLAKVVSDYYVQTKTAKASKNVRILQKQTDSVRVVLNMAISGVAASIDAAPNANPSLQVLHVPSQRKQVDVQANSAILNELVKNLELSKMSLLQQTPLIQVIDRPILPLDIEKTGKVKATVIGGFIAMLLAVFVLLLKRLWNSFWHDN
jgi:uncharacterized protein involved in exopolysaccharide biosynthesis